MIFSTFKSLSFYTTLPSAMFFSFPIAIKSSKLGDTQSVSLLMDEAKSMIEIGIYHNHIVNLQGVTLGFNPKTHQLTDVSIQKIEK